MVEFIEVASIAVNHPEIITLHQLGFDHSDDFFTFDSLGVDKLDGIAKGITSFHDCH